MTSYTYVVAAGTEPPLWSNPARWMVGETETGGVPGVGDTAISFGATLDAETLKEITIEGKIDLQNATLDTSVLLTDFPSEGGEILAYGDDLFAGTFDVGVAGVQTPNEGGIGLNAANTTLVNTGVIKATQYNFSVVNDGSVNDSFINKGVIEYTYGGNNFGEGFAEDLDSEIATGEFFSNEGTIIVNGSGAPSIGYAQGNFSDTVNGSGTIEVTHGLLQFEGVAAGQTIDFEDGSSKVSLRFSDFSTTPFLGQIEGFRPGDTIFVAQTVTTVDPSTPGVVRLLDGVTPVGSLDITPAPGKTVFTVTQVQGLGSDIGMGPACYAAGTRPACPGGEVAVEEVRAGDLVLTAAGAARRVVWVGERRVACAGHSRPESVWPVRVRAGAFGEGMPRRDLRLSPDHAVFCGGVLVPVRYLLNGATIAQEAVARVHYLHVELERHELLLAEGLACESFLDTGNRAAFASGGVAAGLGLMCRGRATSEGRV